MFSTIRFSKTWRMLAMLLVILILVPGFAFAQEKQIVDIRISGNEHITTDAIMAIVPLKPGTAYNEQAVQAAQKAIQDMGYFERVIVGTENVDSGVRVIFNVIENPVVKEINITGNTVISTEHIRSLMRSTVGNVLNTNTLLQVDIPAIEQDYDKQGNIAYVTEEVGIDPLTGILTIPILEVKVEDIRVTGNKKTNKIVILREMNLKKGDVFNRQTLFNDLRRIYDLEIFDRETAEPYRLEAGSDLGKVIITIPVKEKKTGEVSVGLGYSSRQRLVGQAKLSESNFRGRAQTVNLLWEQSGDRGSSYELGFFEPWLDKKHTSLGLNVYNKLIFRFTNDILRSGGEANDYDERRQGGSATLSRPLSKTGRGFLTLRSESVDSEFQTSKILSSNGSITSGTFRFTNSNRDSELEPFTGLYSSYAVELGSADFANQGLTTNPGNNTFVKYSTDLRRYFSKGGPRKELNERRRVIAVRLMGGSITGDVPFFEQYFLGGAETLRGYQEDRFWGKNMLLGSAELRLPVAPSLTGVLFVDYGDAWGANNIFRDPNNPELTDDPFKDLLEDMPQHESFSGNLGYGLGIRVATPIGPLRLDYGFGSDGSRAHFSIGHVF